MRIRDKRQDGLPMTILPSRKRKRQRIVVSKPAAKSKTAKIWERRQLERSTPGPSQATGYVTPPDVAEWIARNGVTLCAARQAEGGGRWPMSTNDDVHATLRVEATRG